MAVKRVRFSVEIPQETDVAIQNLAKVENRPSKKNMHEALLNRIDRIWRETPQKAIEIGLIRPEHAPAR